MTPTPSHVATDELIETLERLEKEATPGPWSAVGVPYYEYWLTSEPPPQEGGQLGNRIAIIKAERWPDKISAETRTSNANLIVSLRNHLPALISALKENKRLREAGEWLWSEWVKTESEPSPGIYHTITDHSRQTREYACVGCNAVATASWPSWTYDFKHMAGCKVELARAALQPQGEK